MRRILQVGSCQRGQATVELALVTPILILLVVGVFEFGRAWNNFQVVTDATREGARMCAVASANAAMAADTVKNTVRNYLNNAGLPATDPVVVGFRDPQGTPCRVTLTVPYQFVFVGALLNYASGTETINLSSSATMRNE